MGKVLAIEKRHDIDPATPPKLKLKMAYTPWWLADDDTNTRATMPIFM